MFYREDQRKEKSDSLKKHTFFHQQPSPPKKDTTFYELTSKFPLAFFNTPWVRDTAKSQSVLKVSKKN